MGALARHDYSSLAPNYDRSRRAEPAIVASLIAGCRQLGARTVLDLGAGTCNYSEELQRAGFQTIALDVSAPMLACGNEKRVASRVGADAELIPLKPASIDVAVCVNVLHHLSDVEMAFREARRVVTKGVVVQIVARENIGSLWYRRYFPDIDRLLLPLHPSLGFVITSLLRANFTRVSSTPIFYSGHDDLTFESARHRPELLFDPSFRASTSGFRRIDSQATEEGLALIKADLESSRLKTLIEQHDDEFQQSGDCFVLIAFV